ETKGVPMIAARRIVWVGLFALLPLFANAHVGQDHAKKPGPVRKEQKEWGIAGDAKAARRTIEMKMTDQMRFTPDRIEVTEGDTVKLVFRNRGKVLHEWVLGTKRQLEEHAALMLKIP